jgi:hypothetical protein
MDANDVYSSKHCPASTACVLPRRSREVSCGGQRQVVHTVVWLVSLRAVWVDVGWQACTHRVSSKPESWRAVCPQELNRSAVVSQRGLRTPTARVGREVAVAAWHHQTGHRARCGCGDGGRGGRACLRPSAAALPAAQRPPLRPTQSRTYPNLRSVHPQPATHDGTPSGAYSPSCPLEGLLANSVPQRGRSTPRLYGTHTARGLQHSVWFRVTYAHAQ